MTMRERCGSEHSLIERAIQGVLRQFRHMERMKEERLIKRICVRSGGSREEEEAKEEMEGSTGGFGY